MIFCDLSSFLSSGSLSYTVVFPLPEKISRINTGCSLRQCEVGNLQSGCDAK